jgi:hypothetical protein
VGIFVKIVWRKFMAAVASCLLALVSCSDHRPNAAEAKADFLRLYPNAEVLSIRVTEDEVVACSFEITYRHRDNPQKKTLAVQYLKSNQGVYKIDPAPPSELP